MKPLKNFITHLAVISLLTPVISAKEVKINTVDDAIKAYFNVIPLQKDSGSWLRYISAKVNSSDTWMLVDSGAHRTFFDVDLAKKNKIKLKKNKMSVRGVGANRTKRYTGVIDSVAIADSLKLSKGKHQFIDLGAGKKLSFKDGGSNVCGGLLGIDVLAQLSFNIDSSRNRILLPKKKKKIKDGLWGLLKQTGYTKIDLVATKSAAYIPVKLGDKEGYFQIDTGSSQTIIYKTFTKNKNYVPLKRGGEVQGVGKKTTIAQFVTVNDFSIPGRNIASPMLVVPSGQLSMISGKPVMGILGVSVIDHLKLIFNFKKQDAYLPKRKS